MCAIFCMESRNGHVLPTALALSLFPDRAGFCEINPTIDRSSQVDVFTKHSLVQHCYVCPQKSRLVSHYSDVCRLCTSFVTPGRCGRSVGDNPGSWLRPWRGRLPAFVGVRPEGFVRRGRGAIACGSRLTRWNVSLS